jgi:hypothetical protein
MKILDQQYKHAKTPSYVYNEHFLLRYDCSRLQRHWHETNEYWFYNFLTLNIQEGCIIFH